MEAINNMAAQHVMTPKASNQFTNFYHDMILILLDSEQASLMFYYYSASLNPLPPT